MPPSRLDAQMGEDERGLVAVVGGLGDFERRFRLFQIEMFADERSYYRPEDDDEMRRMLVTYISLRSALIRNVWRYQRFAQIEDEKLRLRALLVHYTACLLYTSPSPRD